MVVHACATAQACQVSACRLNGNLRNIYDILWSLGVSDDAKQTVCLDGPV